TRWLPSIMMPECSPSPPRLRTTVKSVIDGSSPETKRARATASSGAQTGSAPQDARKSGRTSAVRVLRIWRTGKRSGVGKREEDENADDNCHRPAGKADEAGKGLLVFPDVHGAMLVFGHLVSLLAVWVRIADSTCAVTACKAKFAQLLLPVQIGREAKADAARFLDLGRLRQRPQHDVQLADMLDELGPRLVLVTTVEGHDV